MKKIVKRLLCVLLMGAVMVMLGACGGAGQQTVICKGQQDGADVEIIIEANNDIITKWTQTSTLPLESLDEETKAVLDTVVEMTKAIYAEYDKVEYDMKITDNAMIEVITIDMSDSDTVKSLADAELLPVTGNASRLSLKMTVEGFESQGWTAEYK